MGAGPYSEVLNEAKISHREGRESFTHSAGTLSYRKVIGVENKMLIKRNLGVLRSVCVCEMKLPQSSWEPRKGPRGSVSSLVQPTTH